MTVQELRNNGYKVRVFHNRLYNGYHEWQDILGSKSEKHYIYGPIDPDAKGGSTQVIIDSPSGENYVGHALCNNKDNYNKKLGVRIAIGRCNIPNFVINQK